MHRRVGGGVLKKDGGGVGGGGLSMMTTNDSLAEWEVLAVDDSIRQSIMGVLSRDWSRISTLNLSPRESEKETPFGSRGRRGISTAKSKEWDQRSDAAVATQAAAASATLTSTIFMLRA